MDVDIKEFEAMSEVDKLLTLLCLQKIIGEGHFPATAKQLAWEMLRVWYPKEYQNLKERDN
jgi:hypothetical protein